MAPAVHQDSASQTSPGREPGSRSLSPPAHETGNFFEQDPHPPTPPNGTEEETTSFGDAFDNDGDPRHDYHGEVPPLPDNLPPATNEPVVLDDLVDSLKFVEMLEEATLESHLSPKDLDALRNPGPHLSTPSDNEDLLLSVSCFIDLLHSSQEAYNNIRDNIQRRDPKVEMLSYHEAKTAVRNLSGIVVLQNDMCVGSCVAFTGPYADLDTCPRCGQSRYDQDKYNASDGAIKIPRRQYSTFPVGPQIQARWKHPETAKKMLYRQERTAAGEGDIYDDIFSGEAYLNLVEQGKISGYDTVLMYSIDGAQLYRDKKSECWMYIWILLEMAPDERYKVRNILPGGIIPGPKPPQHLESFLFPGLVHVSALQKEGLRLYDSYSQVFAISLLYILLVLADAVAMAKLTGSVGHHGKKGCRLLCDLEGRNKIGKSHYYPAMLQPLKADNTPYDSRSDIDVNNLPLPNPETYRNNLNYLLTSPTPNDYKDRRGQTGITKPSIFDGLPRILELPCCFPGDLMHQPVINLPALLFDLWCQRKELRKHDKESDWPWAVLTGKVWEDHGTVVAEAGHFLPRSFDCVPRNPQEKISSGYKACEFLIYVYVLGPGVFYGILPDLYYQHFCKLVHGIRLIYQRSISPEQLGDAHQTLLEYCIEFEHIYYERKPERLHFVRQSIHSLTHLGHETARLGPLSLSAQWTMERLIGVLGSLVKQPSNPFANLTEQTKKMVSINALLAMWPKVGHERGDPQGSINLGGGYILLGPKDDRSHEISAVEKAAVTSSPFLDPGANMGRSVFRWGRLKIPNGQIARSYWKEVGRSKRIGRTDRMLKVSLFRYAMFWF